MFSAVFPPGVFDDFALAATLALSCLVTSASAQNQPGTTTAPPRAGAQATKPAVTKRTPKANATAKPSGPVESGPCQLGVIPALGDQFVVQKVGLTVFGNERTEVPIDWGLNDIVVARVRAAAPGTAVRRLAYARGAFEPYYNPPTKLFHNPQDDLTAIVRRMQAASATSSSSRSLEPCPEQTRLSMASAR